MENKIHIHCTFKNLLKHLNGHNEIKQELKKEFPFTAYYVPLSLSHYSPLLQQYSSSIPQLVKSHARKKLNFFILFFWVRCKVECILSMSKVAFWINCHEMTFKTYVGIISVSRLCVCHVLYREND